MKRHVESFWDIADRYQTFVFDIWGVVHDGIKPLAGVHETLRKLKQQNKFVSFLSNMPHDAQTVEQHLSRYGIQPEDFDVVYSSGQAAIDYTEQLLQRGLTHAFLLGQPGSMSRLMGVQGMHFVSDIQLADVLILSHDDNDSFAQMKRELLEAAERGVPMVCTNPDRFYLEGAQLRVAAGSVAQLYKAMGGEVLYIGKPHAYVYEKLAERFPKGGHILAIGDSLDNDILGATQMRWDSLLVLTGISSAYNENQGGSIHPTYFLNHF